MPDAEYGKHLDKLNPDLTQDLERVYWFLVEAGPQEFLARLKAILIRQYRYGKGHGYEGAMAIIRSSRSEKERERDA